MMELYHVNGRVGISKELQKADAKAQWIGVEAALTSFMPARWEPVESPIN